MKHPIEWRRNASPVCQASAGWEACIGETYVGQVFADGSAFIPAHDGGYRYVEYGSQPIAAEALIAAAEACR